ncbi:DNA mismatch repair protein MutS [Aristophania vespae]|uniref:DNA mismatch repair protein MutS n=1 Tax=Aristophania vespae TaxID=2697033 RepID=A0A6P1NDI5_9PROT|nr:DNA mismatch repair protein MutS [Aristophania vespae]QHI96366.1 DNA mismatch repair protein MutS [Aristophania vespae]
MPIPSPENATPSMAQWFALKEQEPDALLFLRVGDFYELFFGDAQTASMALDIVLTSRGTHNDKPIPMCGVPANTVQVYIARLIKRGFRVAVAEQTEKPTKGQKGPLRREIVRIVSPGTLIEDELLEAGRANILLCAIDIGKKNNPVIGAAWIDISTGTIETVSATLSSLSELLARLDPSEILAQPNLIPEDYHKRLTPPPRRLTAGDTEQILSEAYKISHISALGDFPDEQITACATLIHYVKRSQAGRLPRLSRPLQEGLKNIMGIDPATRQSLEILQSRDGGSEHTLFNSVNQTLTAAGMRLLARQLSAPSSNLEVIQKRQNGWFWLQKHPELTEAFCNILKHTPDCARALGRISSKRTLPRDLATVRDTLRAAESITELLTSYKAKGLPPYIASIASTLYGRADTLLNRLIGALSTELPSKIEDGGVIAPGFDLELDKLRELRDGGRRKLAQLQVQLAEKYGVPNLKVKYHNQLGYVIEVTVAASGKLKNQSEFTFRQGTANLARFSSEELSKLDQEISEAGEKAALLERHLFDDLCDHIISTPALDEVAVALAKLDVLLCCTKLYNSGTWCCPKLSNGKEFSLKACRHPVVEDALKQKSSPKVRFIPNDCNLPPEKHIALLTGPNMAGKSTFLRQTALAVILAQAGLPVPAESAEIGLVDRLFSRVGAADDLARGRSTFMVEMTETAAILNQAGPYSLVVVDEIGRGTSTLDGLAIAWATLETLHSQLQSRTIFATHFHELGHLVGRLPKLAAYTMAVREWEGKVIFQHEVKTGLAGKSWGLHVAKLAGIPKTVLGRAQKILAQLEKDQTKLGQDTPEALPLFGDLANNRAAETSPQFKELEQSLTLLEPDSLTPRQAHEILYRLKDLAKKTFS